MSGLVTGEAVALGMDPAKLPSRALATTIDLVVYWTGFVGLMFVLAAATSSLDDAAIAAVSVGAMLLILVGVPIAVETLTRGRSLGKMACGLRVVRDDGGPIRFRHALVRGAVGVIEIQLSLGVIACIASLVSARGRRLGDVFGGALVVRERVPRQHTQLMPPAPPWLAAQLTGVDLSGVPEGLWLAVRQYLSRMWQLDPQVGWSMAERLATDVANCTGARVPQGAPPAAFLAAVVAERQSRDARRMFGAGGAPGGPVGPSTGSPAGPFSGPQPPVMPSPAPLPPTATPTLPPVQQVRPAPEPPRTGFAPPA
ncbi:RDD family protein [Streptomyces sp. SPB162]|uniref:RDD family protein n=1 Tax=Streptomyces sp. SPB162 TaxID=2940560 RepID=UPI0024063634|nr:RDD family protein [Streptomyces sp. SPB162]MDF9813532.1 putative RDD family membrane protein YckC [Streptomyces sp. SPB162]